MLHGPLNVKLRASLFILLFVCVSGSSLHYPTPRSLQYAYKLYSFFPMYCLSLPLAVSQHPLPASLYKQQAK
jgi:hypothetical protein